MSIAEVRYCGAGPDHQGRAFHAIVRRRHEDGFHPPLDAIDSAARVVDTIFTGYTTGNHP